LLNKSLESEENYLQNKFSRQPVYSPRPQAGRGGDQTRWASGRQAGGRDQRDQRGRGGQFRGGQQPGYREKRQFAARSRPDQLPPTRPPQSHSAELPPAPTFDGQPHTAGVTPQRQQQPDRQPQVERRSQSRFSPAPVRQPQVLVTPDSGSRAKPVGGKSTPTAVFELSKPSVPPSGEEVKNKGELSYKDIFG